MKCWNIYMMTIVCTYTSLLGIYVLETGKNNLEVAKLSENNFDSRFRKQDPSNINN